MNAHLESALNQVKRLETTEDLQKKAYDDLKKKIDEELDGYGELQLLKLATFSHFSTKWETANEDKPNGEVTQLKNAFPITLGKHFAKEIEEHKSDMD